MGKYLLKNATLINNGREEIGNLLIENQRISRISSEEIIPPKNTEIIDASNKWLIPGVIDDQVHFREPGLTHKADIFTESRAAAAGGVTSYMEMPNTNPQTVTIEELDKKFKVGAEKSLVNYSFYFGATNDNIDEIRKVDPSRVCGIKVFMGASTGNMLVDDQKTLEAIFAESPTLIATHCEDEATIRKNMAQLQKKFGENIAVSSHPIIRSEEACFLSSSLAVSLADKFGSRLHILHISTARELSLFRNDIPSSQKSITAEVCIHHLWFNDSYYDKKGSLIKWNPAVKTENDRASLFEGILNDKLDVIATDHAPHTLEEKQRSYFNAPSGGPMVQHSLVAMLEFAKKGKITVGKVVDKMCHKPAELFHINERGFLMEGYYADLVLIDPDNPWQVDKSNLFYKCGWSPMEDEIFTTQVVKTFVNGEIVYDEGKVVEKSAALPLVFNHE